MQVTRVGAVPQGQKCAFTHFCLRLLSARRPAAVESATVARTEAIEMWCPKNRVNLTLTE
jgi:hypothetical protein